MTNDEPVQFWTFTGNVLTQLGYHEPFIHIPFMLVLMIAYLLQFLHLIFHKHMKEPFLTPLKVCLAGTHHYYSCEKAKRDLGYKPKVSLKQGIDLAIKEFQIKNC